MTLSDYRRQEKDRFQTKKEEQFKIQQQLVEELKENIKQKNEPPKIISVKADMQSGEIYNKVWNKTINVGSMNTLLLANTQYHLIYLSENLGFKYGRVWNVFSTKMMLTDG